MEFSPIREFGFSAMAQRTVTIIRDPKGIVLEELRRPTWPCRRPRRDCGMNLTKTQTRMRIRVSGRREGEGKTIPARKVKKPKIEKYRLGKNV